MTEIQKQLLSLLKHALFKAPTDVTETPEIVAEARSQSVSTLVARDNVTLAQNLRVINVHAELTEVLGGIQFTTFKGYASAYYYPQPIYRPMGDVDFIVAQENYWASVESLENAGYTKKRQNMSGMKHSERIRLLLSSTQKSKKFRTGLTGS